MRREWVAALVSLSALAPRHASAQEAQSFEEPRAAEPAPAAPASRSRSSAYDPFQLKFTGGAMYHRIFTVPFYGTDLGFAVGGQPTNHNALYVTLNVFRGRTEYGLTTTMVRVGGAGEWIANRFRAGVGIEGLYLGFARVGRGSIDTAAVGLDGTLSLDIAKVDGSAVFLGARFDLDLTWQGSVAWGPGAFLGFRYGSR